MEQARKKKHDVNASANHPIPAASDEDLSHLPRWVYDSEAEDDTNHLEKVLQRELEKVASRFRKIPVPEPTQPSQPHQKPP